MFSDKYEDIRLTIMSFIIVVASCVFFWLVWTEESEEDACLDVGGEYTVVGREYSPAAKSMVDMYGCVKE